MYREKIAQIEGEFDRFIDLLRLENATSYLEIGSQYGGSLWKASTALPIGSRIVSIDLPWGDGATRPHLQACIDALKERGYDAKVYFGDSTRHDIFSAVARDAPFDVIFIDGNHTLPFVRQDWENYKQLGRIIAFHDIVWDRPVRPGRLPIEVSKLWKEIKNDYIWREIIEPGSEKGIGVLWMN